jgi:hypothetical protein
MGMIFDTFPNRASAESFARSLRKLKAIVFDSAEELGHEHPFPFELVPPIVLVERRLNGTGDIDYKKELYYVRKAKRFGGQFAGT